MRPLALILALLVLVALPAVAHAEVFTVDRTDDPATSGNCVELILDDCALRRAVALAALSPDPDVVVVARANLTSTLSYGGPGALTITGPGARGAIDSIDGPTLAVLAGAGSVRLERLSMTRHNTAAGSDPTVLIVATASPFSTELVDVSREGSATGGSLVALAPPSGRTGSATLVNTSIFDGPLYGAALTVDSSTLVMRGAEIDGGSLAIRATGASSLRLVTTRIASPQGTAIDLGDGALILRHATLVSGELDPLVRATGSAVVDVATSLLIGGRSCFDAASVHSNGWSYTDRSPAQCPELTAGGDARSLAEPARSAIDALASCGDDGAGGPIVDDQWSVRPVDGNGDRIAQCDVGAREVGVRGALTWSSTTAEVRVGETIAVHLNVDRHYRTFQPLGRLSLVIPATLRLAETHTSRTISCGTGSTLVCTVTDAASSLPPDHHETIDLSLVAIAPADVQLTANEQDTTTAGLDPNGAVQHSFLSTWSSTPLAVHISPVTPDTPATKLAGRGCTILGTPAADYLVGTSHADVICGLGGGDTIRGGGGDDRVIGGDGKDVIDGEAGADWIEGGPGRDRLRGGPGSDRISGGGGADLIWGGAGDDRLAGGAGSDVVDGGTGSDRIAAPRGDRARHVEHGLAKRGSRRR